MSGIAQTLTLDIAIVLSNLGAPNLKHLSETRVRCGDGECIPVQYDGDRDEEGLNLMVTYWERLGLLGPIYRLIGRGLNDHEIATRLDITEVNVQGCIAWLMHFLDCSHRRELVDYASGSLPTRRVVRAA